MGEVWCGTVADKDQDKDAGKDVEENKYFMKDNLVWSLPNLYLPSPILPTYVNLLVLNLSELI